jgi:hypothetical protein
MICLAVVWLLGECEPGKDGVEIRMESDSVKK